MQHTQINRFISLECAISCVKYPREAKAIIIMWMSSLITHRCMLSSGRLRRSWFIQNYIEWWRRRVQNVKKDTASDVAHIQNRGNRIKLSHHHWWWTNLMIFFLWWHMHESSSHNLHTRQFNNFSILHFGRV